MPLPLFIGQAIFGSLKAVVLVIYPLNRKRLNEIEKQLANHRPATVASNPE